MCVLCNHSPTPTITAWDLHYYLQYDGNGGGQKVGGGKVTKVSKVAKERVNSTKKDSRQKPSIDGLTFSVSPVKMKKVSLRGKTLN